MTDKVLSDFTGETVTVDERGQVTARPRVAARRLVEDLGPNAALVLIEIPAGRFQMGSPYGQGGEDERPSHLVSLPSFFMGQALVTQAQWLAVMGKRLPCRFSGEARPVENVSWTEAQAFCDKLSKRTRRAYHLPSEAQWEYACRAGTSTPFYTGPTLTAALANYCGEHLYRGEAPGPYRHVTTEAGAFPPNPFGLYDMAGNVWQWCADTWHPNYTGAPASETPWTTRGDPKGRPVRGGSWHDTPAACRSAARARYDAAQGDDFVGFRVACVGAFN
ncbi:MAG: formylglycine-generating enzyme family protein [Anaerolineales bacterium]